MWQYFDHGLEHKNSPMITVLPNAKFGFTIYWLVQTIWLVRHVANGEKCGATASLIWKWSEPARGWRMGAIYSSHGWHAYQMTCAILAPSCSHRRCITLSPCPLPPPLSATAAPSSSAFLLAFFIPHCALHSLMYLFARLRRRSPQKRTPKSSTLKCHILKWRKQGTGHKCLDLGVSV